MAALSIIELIPLHEVSLTDDSALDAVLAIVRMRTGFDFSAFRRPTITRRVRNRMLGVGTATLPEYLALLERDEGETARLLDRLTIKVSRFYRDAPAFDRLRREVLPALAASAGGRPLRVWSAGCGRGEEAFTLAMLLEEAGIAGTVTATDIDAGALAHAHLAVYADAAATELPPELRARFTASCEARRGHFTVAPGIHARVAWRVDDLSAPRRETPAYDLVCCRNVLIYLERPAQDQAMRRLAASIAARGYLVLGEAEWPSASVLPSLEPVSHRQRIFRARAAEMAPA